MSRHWITVDRLFDGTGGPARHDVAVGIDQDRIVDVVPAGLLGSGDVSRGETVRRIPDSTLLPGLIDAHVHLLFTCDADHERTRRSFETADDAALSAVGVRNAAEALLGGVTTVRDCGDTRGIVGTIRDAERDGWLIGPRILSAGAPLTTESGHLNWCGNVAATDEEAWEAAYAGFEAMHDTIGKERGWPPYSRARFQNDVGPAGATYSGSPERVAQKIVDTVRTLGIGRFDLKYATGTMGHDDLMRSIELYGTEVIPRVRELLA